MDSLVLMGPPGAGKGTQAKFLCAQYGFYHLSTGDLVRKEIAQETERGRQIKSLVASGNLPGDEFIYALLEEEVKRIPLTQGIIFDGFPRRLSQATYLESLLSSFDRNLGWVVSIEVDQDILIKRITGRLSCKKCGASYNLYYKNPKKEGVCDFCGSLELEKRSDDTEAALVNRLSEYKNQVLSISDFYKKRGVFYSLNGNCEESEVSESLKKIVG